MSLESIKYSLPGLLGGMGTIATIEFIHTVHKFDKLIKGVKRDQDFSTYMLLNKTDTLDRTDIILNEKNKEKILCANLKKSVESLIAGGASFVIPLCFTAFAFLKSLDKNLQRNIISIPYITLDMLLENGHRSLIFCTLGSVRAKIFETEKNWRLVEKLIIKPDSNDQNFIHSLIYKIKSQQISIEETIQHIETLCKKYKVKYFIAGCTEIHLASSEIFFNKKKYVKLNPIDPLLLIAEKIASNAPIPNRYFMSNT